jgi:hypothetical protein
MPGTTMPGTPSGVEGNDVTNPPALVVEVEIEIEEEVEIEIEVEVELDEDVDVEELVAATVPSIVTSSK